MNRLTIAGISTLLAVTLAAGLARADPNKDESGKGREKRDGRGERGGGGERDKELRKDVEEANRELRKAEEERERELDKARDEADREGKPEKYDEKRVDIWSRFREKEDKIRSKLREKHGPAYERDYDGPREEYRRLPEGWDDEPERGRPRDREREPNGGRGPESDRAGRGEWVKYAQLPPAVKRTLDRERGRYEIKRIVRDGRDGGRETYRAIIDRKGDDRVVVIWSDGQLIDDFRTAGVPVRPRR